MKSVIGQFSKASKGEISDQEVTRAKWVMLKTTVVQLTWPILSTPPPPLSEVLLQGKLASIFLCAGLSSQLDVPLGVACSVHLVVPSFSTAVPGMTLIPVDSILLWVPPQCMLVDTTVWFSEGVPNLTPILPSDLDVDYFLFSFCYTFLQSFWPVYGVNCVERIFLKVTFLLFLD